MGFGAWTNGFALLALPANGRVPPGMQPQTEHPREPPQAVTLVGAPMYNRTPVLWMAPI